MASDGRHFHVFIQCPGCKEPMVSEVLDDQHRKIYCNDPGCEEYGHRYRYGLLTGFGEEIQESPARKEVVQ